jgi:hypothetical protein
MERPIASESPRPRGLSGESRRSECFLGRSATGAVARRSESRPRAGTKKRSSPGREPEPLGPPLFPLRGSPPNRQGLGSRPELSINYAPRLARLQAQLPAGTFTLLPAQRFDLGRRMSQGAGARRASTVFRSRRRVWATITGEGSVGADEIRPCPRASGDHRCVAGSPRGSPKMLSRAKSMTLAPEARPHVMPGAQYCTGIEKRKVHHSRRS